MNLARVWRVSSFPMVLASLGALSGCANYEVNTGRGAIAGHYIRYEVQEADRAVESARRAGKDLSCPAEFQAAEDAKNHAYDVFRAHTEEGAALARLVTAKANALCPPQAARVEVIGPLGEPAELKPEPKHEPAKPKPDPVRLKPEPVKPKPETARTPPAVIPFCISLKVEFDSKSARIDPRYYDQVNSVGEYLKKYPTTSAVIEGHTDSHGTPVQNLELSLQRADSVVNYLMEKFGIAGNRLSARGYGANRRIADNKTPEGRQQNRRINAIIDCVLKK
jgi:OmpA-OmpF porin, OOP family